MSEIGRKFATVEDRLAEHEQKQAQLHDELYAEKLRLIGCFKRVFHSTDGARVLAHLDSRFRRSPIAVPGDAVSTQVRVGERNVVEYIIATIEQEYSDVQVEQGSQDVGG